MFRLQDGFSIKWRVTRRMPAGHTLTVHAASGVQRHGQSTALHSYKDGESSIDDVVKLVDRISSSLDWPSWTFVCESTRNGSNRTAWQKCSHCRLRWRYDLHHSCCEAFRWVTETFIPSNVQLTEISANRFRRGRVSSFGRKRHRWSSHSDGEFTQAKSPETSFN